MTVSTTINKVSYIGNGIATTFAIPFPFLEKEHLKVRQLLNNVQMERTDWTISGGNMVFATAPADGAQIVIMREVPLTQETDYRENEVLPAETLERNFDKLTMQVQQLNEKSSRAVTVDVFSNDNPNNFISEFKSAIVTAQNAAGTATTQAGIATQQAQVATQAAARTDWVSVAGTAQTITSPKTFTSQINYKGNKTVEEDGYNLILNGYDVDITPLSYVQGYRYGSTGVSQIQLTAINKNGSRYESLLVQSRDDGTSNVVLRNTPSLTVYSATQVVTEAWAKVKSNDYSSPANTYLANIFSSLITTSGQEYTAPANGEVIALIISSGQANGITMYRNNIPVDYIAFGGTTEFGGILKTRVSTGDVIKILPGSRAVTCSNGYFIYNQGG